LNDARDPVTGLFNRLYLDDILPREINRARRHGSSIGLAALKLEVVSSDDRSTRKPGDALLCDFGYLLRLQLRAEDTACRVDAGDFILVLPGISAADLPRRAVELRGSLERYYAKKVKRFRGEPVFKLAIAAFPEDGLTARGLLGTLREALDRSCSPAGLASNLNFSGS
jgi:diguanylate cyclase (GGDEF)-like protein